MKKIFIGIDVSKETIDVTVIFNTDRDAEPLTVGYDKFENNPKGFRKMLSWIKKSTKKFKTESREWLFCCETTGGYDHALCSFVYAKGLDIWRESALQIKYSVGARHGKNDKADSKEIAIYAMNHMSNVKLYAPANQDIIDLKELLSYRKQLVKEKAAAKARLSEKKVTSEKNGISNFISRETRKEIKRLDEAIDRCDDAILDVIRSNESMSNNYYHIVSIKGIGFVCAIDMIVYTENFTGMDDPNKYAQYCGLHIAYDDSGTSVHKMSKLNNAHDKLLKSHLTQAARSSIRYNAEIKAYADRLLNAGKPYSIVLNNVRNKLVHIAFSLVRTQTDYEKEHERKRRAAS